ncbi:RHS repeat-associated core domain-containing protein [Streptomyces sp. NPDC102467]|uniref:RHS repeat-associated core domain-containing protein n=1 Tax=Streptomyces sp. NPDC102467 TaxID=3366179 RepID=UPI003806A9B8
MHPFGPGLPRTGSLLSGRRRTWPQRTAAVLGLALLPGLLTPVAFAANKDPLGRPDLAAPEATKVSKFTAKTNSKNDAIVERSERADVAAAKRARQDQARTVTWPSGGSATLTLPTGTTAASKATATPGALPVTLAAPEKNKVATKLPTAAKTVKVTVLDQKASRRLGVKGMVLSVTGPSSGGSARLGLGYAKFASAYGGDWAGRLQLQQLPACALDDPAQAKCRTRTPLAATNNRGAQTLTSQLTFAPAAKTSATAQPMLLALAAGTQSGGGDYKATPLAASSTWEAGGSSGSFTWSYPLRTPPAAAGPQPDLSISYDSGSVDGRTASTNNQGSQIGEGFDLTSSYIERKYGSCDDDGQDGKYDLCWKYDNASLVLNGKASELVKDDTTGVWHLKNDDASTVKHLTGASNNDDDGEYWTLTTGDGTTYTFGLNKLDGAPADQRTDSVWTVPVFGDDDGEPGYKDGTSFAGRAKTQAWRWNLDLVEDTHENAASYWYTAEANNYDKLGDDTTGTGYTRGGYLKEIRYGQRADELFSATPAASNKVTFSYDQRCLASGTGCDALTEDTRDNWPDVPFDAICKNDAKCTGNVGPTFFTRMRLTGITTYAWDAAATTPGYAPVDAWSLKQLYLDPGDTGDATDQSLWLDEIKHTGKHGTDLALDPVKFTHMFLPNRVDGPSDDILSLEKPRLQSIVSEAGAKTVVTYKDADCLYGQTMPKVDTNSKNCYPVYWSPNGEKTPILDWFQKYPVSSVSITDTRGGSEAVVHSYQYDGGGAWHYNDDPMTPAKERTWSLWRGYSKVTHLTGDHDSAQLKTVTISMRGMNGDRVLGSDGKTPDPDKRKTATVTGIKAAAITDSDQYAGFTRESVTYNGSDEVGGQISDPWSKKTATQHKSYADTEAYFIRTGATHSRTRITSSVSPTDRVRTTATTYDDYGMAQTVQDGGNDAVTGDETCTRTWYARNDTLGINSLVSRSRTTAKTCATTDDALDLPADSTRPGDVISDTATAYDTTTWSATQTPTKGEPKWTGRATGYTAADAPIWQKIATTTYDTLGRPLTVKNTNDLTTATSTYKPATTGPLTSTTVANTKGHTVTTDTDFATGAALKATDPNGKVTESEYDSLGRVTKVWLPNHLSSAFKTTPSYTYDYKVTSTDLSWTSTSTLQGDGSGYNTAYTFYDSLLRPRQTQTPTPVGGRLVGITLYDDRGLAVSTQGDIWDDKSAPGPDVVQTEGSAAPIQTDTTYDGAGRATKAVTQLKGVTRWTTTTAYTGDTVTATAPAGSQATSVITNALGQTTERREYAGPNPSGDYTATTYAYTPAGQQKSVTASADKSAWSYTYDLFGRQISAADPDKGKTTSEYDSLDRKTLSTDAENNKLLFGYDDLNRQTGLWQTDKSDGNKLAAWTFDTAAKGQADDAIRYVGGTSGKAYTDSVTAYNSLYQPTFSKLTLPDTDPLVMAGAPKSYSYTTGYTLDGAVKQQSEPAVGGLPSETVSYTFNDTGQQVTASGTTGYLQGATYSPQGDLTQLALGMQGGDSAKKAYLHYDYEPGTRRLTRSFVTDDVHAYMPQELKFSQDDAGNVTSIFDATTQGDTAKADNQCFTYDGNRRLTEAWTPKTADCATTSRSTTNLDGPAPYWTSYEYTAAGQRRTQTQHATSGTTTTNYTYGGTPTNQPHPLTQTVTGSTTGKYVYDDTGNTTSRPSAGGQQALTWNSEGKLATTSTTKNATSYLYDASGDLLIRRATGDGETVLYLGSTEVHLTTKGTTKTLAATRSYSAAGQAIAVRTATAGVSGTKLNFLAADNHGTSSVALDATTYAVTKRYSTPFGAPRGIKPTTWPDDKGFLGKPTDNTTGLTHVGAREYDPSIGQFLSVDPILTLDQNQSLNGYSYANQHPTTSSDPTGLQNAECATRVATDCRGGVPTSDSTIDVSKENTACHPGEWCWDLGGAAPVPAPYEGAVEPIRITIQSGPQDNDLGCGIFGAICRKTGELFYGAISNIPHTAEYFGWVVDGDCWGSGGPGSPGCDYGAQFDAWIADHGYDINSGEYRGPSQLAAMFAAGREGSPTGKGTIVGPRTKSTHNASVQVLNARGELVNAYSLRSGSQTPEEAALGFPNNAQASHTEARVGRMSGGSATVRISNDRYANLARVSKGDTVTINGTKPPCSQCRGSMTRVAEETGATFVYVYSKGRWSSDG